MVSYGSIVSVTVVLCFAALLSNANSTGLDPGSSSTIYERGESATSYMLTPGTAVSERAELADELSDSAAAVNTGICGTRKSFGPNGSATIVAVQTYLKIGGFRHVRDGVVGCSNQKLFDAFFGDLFKYEGVRQIGEGYAYWPTTVLGRLKRDAPGLEALEYLNEDDLSGSLEGALKATPAGAQTIDLGSQVAAKRLIPGEVYSIEDPENPETFTISADQTDVSAARLTAPLRFAHAAGTKVKRVGDWISETEAWYKNEVPILRAANPTFPILGPSLAFGTHASLLEGRGIGDVFDIAENHGYPNSNRAPEGLTGDWYSSDIGVNRAPCSVAGSSFFLEMNMVCSVRQIEGPRNANKPNWTTEFSFEVCPIGSTPPAGAPNCIPDDVAVDYLAGVEIGLGTHGVQRLYWFQMQDGTSGPKSGFCPYGLIRDHECSTDAKYPMDPEPKPEFLALMSIIGYFRDPACSYPTCSFELSPPAVRWSDPSLPLNTANFEWSDGRVAIAFWQGQASYTWGVNNDPGPCKLTMSCYVKVPTRREVVSSPRFAHARVELEGIDDDANDPTPAPYATTAPDGSDTVVSRPDAPAPGQAPEIATAPKTRPMMVIKCPNGPTSRPEFGCILPPRLLEVAGVGDQASVTVTAARRMQWIVVQPFGAPPLRRLLKPAK